MIKKCPECKSRMFSRRKRRGVFFYLGLVAVLVAFWIESSRRRISLTENIVWGVVLVVLAGLSIYERGKGKILRWYCKNCGRTIDYSGRLDY